MMSSRKTGAASEKIPVVVALQDQVSGVKSWALRLREAFSGHPDYRILILLHGKNYSTDGARFDLHAPTEADIKKVLQSLDPVIVVPNWLYFIYPICARLIAERHDLKIVGFCRADDDEQYYNPLDWCEPLVSQFVAVSPECQKKLARRIPERESDISCIPTGVFVPDDLQRDYNCSPIRLVYGGRITQLQKRVMDFVPLVEELLKRRVNFEFNVYGEGDHLEKLTAEIRKIPHEGRVRIHERQAPDSMPGIWADHDVFIQTSDFEGTSNSMLESMAQGTVPLLTRTDSGIDGIVNNGANGFVVEVGDMKAMAACVERLSSTPGQLQAFGRAAYLSSKPYSMETCRDRFAAILDRVRDDPIREWPKDRPYLPEVGVYQYHPATHEEASRAGADERIQAERVRMKSLARRSIRKFLSVTKLNRPLRRYLPGLLDLQVTDPSIKVRASLWRWFLELTPEKKNEHCFNVMKFCMADQRFLLYGWPVQQQYARFISDYMPGVNDIRVLELGPGDNLMISALWMLDERVESVTMMDKYKGVYIESGDYHLVLHDFARMLALTQRSGFYNYYPFDSPNIERMKAAIRTEGDVIVLDPNLLKYVHLSDFTKFPLDDASFDFTYSHATLEHFTTPVESIKELYRVLTPGGVMIHQIDLRDHRYFDEDPYRFLEVPSDKWNFGDLAYPVNQWRANHYRDAIRDAGFEMLEECKVLRDPDKARDVDFAPEFAKIPGEDLLVTQAIFISRKPDE